MGIRFAYLLGLCRFIGEQVKLDPSERTVANRIMPEEVVTAAAYIDKHITTSSKQDALYESGSIIKVS
jgi:hypothetical protein